MRDDITAAFVSTGTVAAIASFLANAAINSATTSITKTTSNNKNKNKYDDRATRLKRRRTNRGDENEGGVEEDNVGGEGNDDEHGNEPRARKKRHHEENQQDEDDLLFHTELEECHVNEHNKSYYQLKHDALRVTINTSKAALISVQQKACNIIERCRNDTADDNDTIQVRNQQSFTHQSFTHQSHILTTILHFCFVHSGEHRTVPLLLLIR